MSRVKGKVVIVTGRALGIGRSAGILLDRERAPVAATDVLDEPGRAWAWSISLPAHRKFLRAANSSLMAGTTAR